MGKIWLSMLAAGMLASSLSFSAEAQTSADSLAFVNADWHWTSLKKGACAGYAEIQLFGRPEYISIVKYPAGRFRTSVVHAPAEQCGTTDVLASKNKAKMALNGSYFNVKTLVPVTFFILDHKIISETADNETYRTDGAVAFRNKNGKKFEILAYDSSRNEEYRQMYHTFLSSGPLLIDNGVEQSGFDMSNSFYYVNHPRSLIGFTKSGECVLVDVDGRFPGKGEGASIPELVAIARYLGLYDALNLDGGGSSTLWTTETGVLNHPSDNAKWDHEGCRKVPNIIIVK